MAKTVIASERNALTGEYTGKHWTEGEFEAARLYADLLDASREVREHWLYVEWRDSHGQPPSKVKAG